MVDVVIGTCHTRPIIFVEKEKISTWIPSPLPILLHPPLVEKLTMADNIDNEHTSLVDTHPDNEEQAADDADEEQPTVAMPVTEPPVVPEELANLRQTVQARQQEALSQHEAVMAKDLPRAVKYTGAVSPSPASPRRRTSWKVKAYICLAVVLGLALMMGLGIGLSSEKDDESRAIADPTLSPNVAISPTQTPTSHLPFVPQCFDRPVNCKKWWILC